VEYKPQLATLVKAPPEGDAWLHEIKFDGYRMGCTIDRGRVRLTSRNGQDYTAALPEIVADAGTLPASSALIDGEVVVLLENGRASFQALQQALAGTGSRASLVYIAFDLLEVDGTALLAQPLEARKARLKALLEAGRAKRIRFSDHIIGQGAAFFEQATKLGLEGVVSKKRDSTYQPGRRTGWLKLKCKRRQPFVIGGYTDQEGMKGGLGALLVGHYDHGRFSFAGRVGSGFTQKITADLLRRLAPLARRTSPFDPPPEGPLARTAHFVEPSLVCAVTFTEWTDDDRIRHPVYEGLVKGADPATVSRDRD
jgi:bifunctional non-homologous end joining protein LigD